MSFFTAERISAGYGRQRIVHEASLALDSGRIMGILGPNGCGKTTLLKAICGILPHEGTCTLDGETLESISARRTAQLCSYIPQRSGISIDISALDVVLMGFNPRLRLLEHPNTAMEEAASRALAQAGLAGKEHVNYLHLSEGQKQLCILARTLVSDGRLLLLDEPESALDFRFRYQMLNTIRQWILEKQRAAIVALHDPSLALNYCDELLLMADGKVLGTLQPEIDSIGSMEDMLSRIYGSISLRRCQTRTGREQLVMLKEEET